MAVPTQISNNQQNSQISSRWFLADSLIKVLPKKLDRRKFFGFARDSHQYFSRRELLSVIEQHLTEK
jgi:hypothetical protein